VADLLSLALRQLIGRDRPPLLYPLPKPLVHTPGTGAFPSGHASVSFACATAIAWASPRLALPAYLLAAAIAFSRVYVGVHYPLDVIAGAALGTAVGYGVFRALPTLARFPRRRRAAPPPG